MKRTAALVALLLLGSCTRCGETEEPVAAPSQVAPVAPPDTGVDAREEQSAIVAEEFPLDAPVEAAPPDCAAIASTLNAAARAGAFGGNGDGAERMADSLDGMATVAPPEVGGDFATLARAYRELAQAQRRTTSEAEGDAEEEGAEPEPQPFEVLNSPEVMEASDRIAAYFDALCQ